MARVGVAARYPALRAGLRAMISATPDLEVVGDAADPTALLEVAPDVEVVVWALDDLDTISGAIEEAASFERLMGVVLIGDAPDTGRAIAELPLPWSWLSREADAPEILAAIAAVRAGLITVDRQSARLLLQALPPRRPGPTPVGEEPLTPREREVLQLMAEGLPNKAIARRLGVSEHTVKFHVASVLAKLRASSRTEAVRLGARAGLVVL